MTDTTPRVGVPLLAAAQAQKSVTHNEALYQFDAFLCARFIDRTHTAPPSSPSDGDGYLVVSGATGTWLGQDGKVAYCVDGAWRFYAPFAGLTAYVSAENKLIVWSGSAWCDFASMIALQSLPMVGVNTTADATNKLSVKSNAVLFSDVATSSGGSGDIRATLSKQASGNTASFLFQDNFSGRAEIGLTGDDNFHFKVSSDGATWHDGMDIAAGTGVVTLASAVLTTADINGGTLDGSAVGASTPSTGKFTTLQATGSATFADGGAWTSAGISFVQGGGLFKSTTYGGTQGAAGALCMNTGGSGSCAIALFASSAASRQHLTFENGNGVVGSISTSGSATSFNTSSDRRLKTDIAPLCAGALMDALAPVTFAWKADGARGAGFIADELQAVVPEAVTGEPGAVDGAGAAIYQSVDHSKLVPHLVAAIRELRARVAVLEG
ncbi:MAG: DUF2793 domain-containing protein [Rhizomicrobium sp.]